MVNNNPIITTIMQTGKVSKVAINIILSKFIFNSPLSMKEKEG